jgi:hypothetical protein
MNLNVLTTCIFNSTHQSISLRKVTQLHNSAHFQTVIFLFRFAFVKIYRGLYRKIETGRGFLAAFKAVGTETGISTLPFNTQQGNIA